MSDHDLHTLTGAYAADALDGVELAAFEHHLQTCLPCQQEAAELRATTARLASASHTTPPAALRTRVLEEVSRTRQLPPVADVIDLSERRAARAWYRQPLGVAAALLLVVATGLGGLASVENRQADQARTLASRVADLASDPDRVERTTAVSTGGSVSMVASGDLALFRSQGLVELPANKTYQLWRISGGDPHPAGVLGSGGNVTHVVTGMGPGDSLGVTIEPAGGSDQPTARPLVLLS